MVALASLLAGTCLGATWWLAFFGEEKQSARNSMAPGYSCPYSTDVGCPCNQYVREGETYCIKHRAEMLHIDALEKEINDVIHKAQQK
ncbi:MAG: hypothetical protein WA239_26665 [Candidatus Sulfotelmatobacter sp.]|jgi:hypothetical protein